MHPCDPPSPNDQLVALPKEVLRRKFDANPTLNVGEWNQREIARWHEAQDAFPGNGRMTSEQLEIARLKREVAKLKAERDILKKAAAYFAKEST